MLRLTGYKGRDGTYTIPIEYDPLGGTNYVDLSLTNARVELAAGDSSIDTDGPYAEITNGNEVTFELGGLDLTQGNYQARIILYNTDYPDGKVIAGPGKPAGVTLQYFVE